MNGRDRIRREIWSLVFDHCRRKGIPNIPIEDQILNITGVAILSDNQELPELPPWAIHEIIKDACRRGQQGLIDDNFKRVLHSE